MNKVHVVDDDAGVREGLAALLESADLEVACHASAEAFLNAFQADPPECLVLDLRMPGKSGIELQAELQRRGAAIPIIFLTAHGDIPTTVRAIKAGAMEFLTKPVEVSQLMEKVYLALRQSEADQDAGAGERVARERLAGLSEREREVLQLAITGLQNKEIARQLDISHRTVEIHRAQVLRKTGAASMIELARLVDILRVNKA